MAELSVEDKALELFLRRWGPGAQWHARRTNRAYYRRLARAEIARQPRDEDQ